jgi:hypothetical protein
VSRSENTTHTYGEPVVTIVSLNLEKDGGEDTPSGGLPQRWTDAHREILVPRHPDVVLRQEATYSARDGERRRVMPLTNSGSPTP